MTPIKFIAATIAMLAISSGGAVAQVPATQIAGNPVTARVWPSNPGGGAIVGNFAWVAQQNDTGGSGGFRLYDTLDTGDPRTSLAWTQDDNVGNAGTVGGNGLCAPFCKVGKVWYDGSGSVYVPAWDQQRGQPGTLTLPGVWRLSLTVINGQPFFEAMPLAPNSGLGGNGPNGVTFNPIDGRMYVVNEKNGNVLTIDNPRAAQNNDPSQPQTVRTIGNTVNGRPARGVELFGPDLYVGTTDELDVFPNVASCGPPAANCNGQTVPLSVAIDGNVVTIQKGAGVVGITRIGQHLYLAVKSLGAVIQYNPATSGAQLVAKGFAFVGGTTNAMFSDDLGNLYVGDDTSDGAILQTGRLWRVNASDLATLQ